jgi:hypothetical protein
MDGGLGMHMALVCVDLASFSPDVEWQRDSTLARGNVGAVRAGLLLGNAISGTCSSAFSFTVRFLPARGSEPPTRWPRLAPQQTPAK